jgi:hypothetical protein
MKAADLTATYSERTRHIVQKCLLFDMKKETQAAPSG